MKLKCLAEDGLVIMRVCLVHVMLYAADSVWVQDSPGLCMCTTYTAVGKKYLSCILLKAQEDLTTPDRC